MTIFSAHAKAALSDIVANHRFISQSPGQLEREKIVNWIFFFCNCYINKGKSLEKGMLGSPAIMAMEGAGQFLCPRGKTTEAVRLCLGNADLQD